MELKIWLIYLITEVLLAVTPGPAVLLISAQGFNYGAKSSYFGSLGISTGNLMYFILAALGLGSLILTAGHLFLYIKIAGAIYLVVSGFLMIYKSFFNNSTSIAINHECNSKMKFFIQGFITQASNPKAIIFFVALIPQFIDGSRNIIMQFTIMSLTTLIIETSVLMLYGRLASSGVRKIGQNRLIIKWKDRLAGFILIGLGLNLIFVKTK